ncbi:aminotransferase class IV [Dactylosporangium sp. NPDC005572]|uniref:aminotransferase class IV n=1 Tax=Dactylosporangium sp. NPDC005572 TaxID=3156889 RepID=UPI0033BC6F8D
MPPPVPLVAVLGRGIVPIDTPIIRADDAGLQRGDGVFEAIHVRWRQPVRLAEHLARLRRSAARVDLPLPSEDALADLVVRLCRVWPDTAEAAVRLVCSRGTAGTDSGTVFAVISAVSDDILRLRRDGVSAATARLGYTVDVRRQAPWLLGGVKLLSYAVAMAAQRWAAARGMDDVVWVSEEGFVLEGATSTVVWLDGDVLCSVPETAGVVPGTTAHWLVSNARTLGWTTQERLVTPEALAAADGVWLLSAIRGGTAVRTLDGKRVSHDHRLTAKILKVTGHSVDPRPVGADLRQPEPA